MRVLLRISLAGALWAAVGAATPPAAPTQAPRAGARAALDAEAGAFLEDLSKRSFQFFWEQTDPRTGIVRDRSRTDGSPSSDNHVEVGSIASVGFGLTGLCIAAEREWRPRDQILDRARTTLRTFAERVEHHHGWFYHWLNIHTGAREWRSEVSSIDTAILLGGVLSARQCFAADPEVTRLADAIYRRIDFTWMRNGHPTVLSHGWRPETGMIVHRWDAYSEAMMLYILGLGSPTHPLPPASWRAWVRPVLEWEGFRYVTHAGPLFLHHYSHAWIDFRAWRDPDPPHDWFENASIATRANQRYCRTLSTRFPGYSESIWGITASDGRSGYRAWGGPPHDPDVDGTVVPCAAGGSLMLVPDIALPALEAMKARFGVRLYGRYGFADAFHPTENWFNPDVIGIDLGITLLAAENLRTGRVWNWFMANPEVRAGMARAGFVPAASGPPFDIPNGFAEYRLEPQPDEAAQAAARRSLETLFTLGDRFEAGNFAAPNGVMLPYRLLSPESTSGRHPLVVVLHGSGEIGADNRRHLTPLALTWARDDTRRRFPAFVLAPQMPMRSADYSGPPEGDLRASRATPAAAATLALVDRLIATRPIDRARVFVIGFSMGASTAWNLLYDRPGLFAAAVPIAGVPDPGRAVGKTRVWVIHGNRDEVNPVRHGRATYVPLVDRGARVRFWEIDRLGHEVPPWLLARDAFAEWLWMK
jgi:predicted esterase